MIIDLQTHTYHSDGLLSPAEVVALALKRNVEILAITDHDVVSGVKEALSVAKNKNIKIIPGIELAVKVKCSNDVIHILGLNIDINNAKLKKLSNKIINLKKLKTEKRLLLVNKHFNSGITYKDLKKKTRGFPGLPHLAMVLLEKGYVKDIKEGIKLMMKGGKLYINFNDQTISAREAINTIHNAKGIALLAHLSAYKNENKFVTFAEQKNLIRELVGYGIDGIELYIPKLSKRDLLFGKKLAKKYNLLISGGSDFHDEKFISENKLGFLNIEKEELTVLSVLNK
jgi:predicted metal-dependent phosphoesterase TrpH